MIKHLILLCILICCPTIVLAEDIDEKYFASWGSLNDLLRSKNIDPTRSSWSIIEPLCMPMKNDADEIAYNKCRFEKATAESEFNLNHDTCSKTALDHFPDSLRDERTIRTVTKTDEHGKPSTLQENVKLYNSTTALEADRRQDFLQCMQSYGWKDTGDWRMGKNEGTSEFSQ